MKAIEIITIRLDPRREDSLLHELRTAVEMQAASDDRVTVELYRHASVKTDLSIHLRSETRLAEGLPCALGRRLASALREFGPISHTAWIEEERQ